MISTDGDYVHHYKLRDERGQSLNDHGGIWLFEIEKFNAQKVASEEQRWLRFLKEGEQLDDQTLPDWMATKEMEQAVTTLRKFSENERDYHEYQARQNFIREQRTIKKELEGALEREQAALAREKAAVADMEAFRAENARLKALLEQRGKPH